MKNIISLFFSCLLIWNLSAQEVLIHSHNDYRQIVPFYVSYSQRVASIEADIFSTSKPGELLVAHDIFELPHAPTLDDAYLQPLVKLFRRNDGRPWRNSDKKLILLVDLKSPVDPTLDILIDKLKQFPEVFDPAVNPYAVRVVISGNRPPANTFRQYPSLITFDGSHTSYTPEQLEKISMISLNFRSFSRWNGKGVMEKDELERLAKTIADVHALGKPVRFWGAPDGVTAWNTFHNLGVDFINTDRPEECALFFRNFENKNYRIDENIDVYAPNYRNDGANTPVKNVILLIGDGMGMVQISAANAVNKGLTMLNLKHIGLQHTQAEDAYTSDSAGAGSSIATGIKNNNRHIAMSATGEAYPSLTDAFHENGYACGVLTLGNIADATPAAFYGHSAERDNSDEITRWLLNGKLNLLTGSGMRVLTNRNDNVDMINDLKSKAGYTIQTSINEINSTKGKVICIDERMGRATTKETLSLLSDATRQAIQKLSDESDKGFFLMVEGAKIDNAGHNNSLPYAMLEMLSFDLAVAEALRFADSNGETLVIVTGDHETGGMTLIDGNEKTGHITVQFMTDDHTPVMLPVLVYGPGASKFTGVYQNTEIYHKVKDAVKIK